MFDESKKGKLPNDIFLNWYSSVDSETHKSAIKFIIGICASLKFKSRVKLAIEILMGKRYHEFITYDKETREILKGGRKII